MSGFIEGENRYQSLNALMITLPRTVQRETSMCSLIGWISQDWGLKQNQRRREKGPRSATFICSTPG